MTGEVNEAILAEILRGKVSGEEALAYARGEESVEPHPVGGYTKVYIDSFADTIDFRNGGRLHRLDGPARIFPETGGMGFYRNGVPVATFTYLVELGLLPNEYSRESWDLLRGVGDGRAPFYVVKEALEGGAPLEWAIAYAQGERA